MIAIFIGIYITLGTTRNLEMTSTDERMWWHANVSHSLSGLGHSEILVFMGESWNRSPEGWPEHCVPSENQPKCFVHQKEILLHALSQ